MSRDAWDDAPSLENLSLGEHTNSTPAISKTVSIPTEIAPGVNLPGQSTSDTFDKSSIDSALIGGLENPRERMNVLKFEDKIVRFLQNRREQQLVFEPLTSYHRLIVHRLAQRFELEHQAVDMAYEGQQHITPVNKGVMLSKTSASRVPKMLLIDLPPVGAEGGGVDASLDSSSPQVAVKQKVLMRRRDNKGGTSSPQASSIQARAQENLTITDREKKYAEARARIFGEQNGLAATTKAPAKKPSKTVGQQAEGPDGSKGFGRGRGSPPSRDLGAGSAVFTPSGQAATIGIGANNTIGGLQSNISPASSTGVSRGEQVVASSGAGASLPLSRRGSASSSAGEAIVFEQAQEAESGRRGLKKQTVNVADWKGSRVNWRDAHADRHDDDFRRGLNKYQRSFAPYRVMELPVSGMATSRAGNGLGVPPPPPQQPQPQPQPQAAVLGTAPPTLHQQQPAHLSPTAGAGGAAAAGIHFQGAGVATAHAGGGLFYGYPPAAALAHQPPQPQVQPQQPQHHLTATAQPFQMYSSSTTNNGYMSPNLYTGYSTTGLPQQQQASITSTAPLQQQAPAALAQQQPPQQTQYYAPPAHLATQQQQGAGYQEDYNFATYIPDHPSLQEYPSHEQVPYPPVHAPSEEVLAPQLPPPPQPQTVTTFVENSSYETDFPPLS